MNWRSFRQVFGAFSLIGLMAIVATQPAYAADGDPVDKEALNAAFLRHAFLESLREITL